LGFIESLSSSHQTLAFLIFSKFRGTLRKLLATYVFTTRGRNYERFYEESRKVRDDFEALAASEDPLLFEATIDKYEMLIEELFEPDASLSKFLNG
jgi:cobalamin biosynthesis Co2+ chelatase CbiK